MRASYETYTKHGNSGSATIFSVLDRLRAEDLDAMASGGRARDHVIACAFGPGIAVETCLLKRNMANRSRAGGLQLQSRSASETSTTLSGVNSGSSASVRSAQTPQARHVADALKCLDFEHFD